MKQKVSELNTPWLLYEMPQGKKKAKRTEESCKYFYKYFYKLLILRDYIII